jgi:hypothetical protein
MDVGASLLARARATGAASIAVVGTSKNAGKTVAVAALCAALAREGARFGLCSIGRDGEALDALDASPKPQLQLRAGALLATPAPLLPAHPALEILASGGERSALGALAFARVRVAGSFLIAGPPSASALRRTVRRLHELGAETVVIDGAVDRLAALRDGDDAVIVATGAASGPTLERAVDDLRALVARLRIPRFDAARPALRIAGALTAADAAELIAAGERRQVVVGDPTQIAFSGRTYTTLAAQLDLRCERVLHVVACTVAPRSPERAFDPRRFLQAAAEATGLPVYDVYAGAAA